MLWRYGCLQSDDSIISLRYRSAGEWLIGTKKAAYPAILEADSLVTHQVIVLRFRIATNYFANSCVIFRDALDKDSYRRLLVALRMG